VTARRHRRVNGQTTEQRIWRLLRKAGPLRISEIAEAIGITRHAASQALLRAKAKGSVVAGGKANQWQNHCHYSATDQRPEDYRGTAVGSVATLVRCAAKRRNRTAKHQPRYTPATALEQAWPINGERA
jgi:predicted ArsR family transcriptional regulator